MYYPADENIKNLEISFLDGLYKLTEAYKNKGVTHTPNTRYHNLIRYLRSVKRKLTQPVKLLMPSQNPVMNEYLPGADYKRPDSDAYFSDQRVAVYSAVFSGYDNITEPLFKPDNVDYYLITDADVPDDSLWQKLDPKGIIPDEITDNILKNRYAKMLPHKFLKDYNYSVYIDGNVLLTSDATVLTASLEDFPVAMHRHKNRDCAYDEVQACIVKQKDEIARLEQHAALLKEHKLPRHFGLLEATVIARKHNDERCIALMERWWAEFLAASRRDQISLADCIWTMGLDIDRMAQLGNNIMKNNHLMILPHVKKQSN